MNPTGRKTSFSLPAAQGPLRAARARGRARHAPALLAVACLALSCGGRSDPDPITPPPPPPPQDGSPYPPSPVIEGVRWDFANLQVFARGSDLWPATWGADGNVYTGWGDGGGFGGSDTDGRVSIGFARVLQNPPGIRGVNVNGGKNAQNPASFDQGKPFALLSVDGTLYAWIMMENGPPPDLRLAWSSDLGATWQLASWAFEGVPGAFHPVTFLNFGRDYAGARDGFVYLYGSLWPQGPDPWVLLFEAHLARVPRGAIRDREAYEFFAGLDASGRPLWSPDPAQARPVLADPNGATTPTVVYDGPLRRFLALNSHGSEIGKLAIFDAPEPWGPWTKVAYEEGWGGFVGDALFYTVPTKWISADGRTFWMIFSSQSTLDAFNLVRGTLTLKDED